MTEHEKAKVVRLLRACGQRNKFVGVECNETEPIIYDIEHDEIDLPGVVERLRNAASCYAKAALDLAGRAGNVSRMLRAREEAEGASR